MNSLAYDPPKRDKSEAIASPASDESGPQYPSLRFNGEQASKAGLTNCRFGEEYEITIRVKATSVGSEANYSGSGTTKDKPAITFDVLASDEPKEIESDEEDKGETEEEEAEETMPERKPKQRTLSPKEAGFDE